MTKTWLRIALINFFIAACMGALLRFAFVEEITWINFRSLMHGHSHVAMLGWLFIGLFALIGHKFLTPLSASSSAILKGLIIIEVSIIGMAISFPIFGYAAPSIAFSCLHIITSYYLIYKAWRLGAMKEKSTSSWFLMWAFIFLILSTLGVWSMMPITMSGRAGSALYFGAIQFYLHFQFNGWFLFAILALFFKVIENNNIAVVPLQIKWFKRLMITATFLTFALAVTWSTPLPFLFALNSVGVLIQLAAILVFIRILISVYHPLLALFGHRYTFLFQLFILSFIVKVLAQSAVVIPYIATVAYTVRNYVIGFIHLILLGLCTTFILAMAYRDKLLDSQKVLTRIGTYLLVLGIVLSEALLFIQGTMLWAAQGFLPGYYLILFIFSMLMPVGIFMILISNLRRSPN